MQNFTMFGVAVNALLLVAFVLVQQLSSVTGSATPAVVLILSIVYAVQSMYLFTLHFIWTFTSTGAKLNMWRPLFLLLSMIFQYGFLITAYLYFDTNSFNSIPADASAGLRLRRGLFMATQTSTQLGSGVIIAAPDAEGAFIIIGLNSFQAWFFSTLIVAEFVSSRTRQNRSL